MDMVTDEELLAELPRKKYPDVAVFDVACPVIAYIAVVFCAILINTCGVEPKPTADGIDCDHVAR